MAGLPERLIASMPMFKGMLRKHVMELVEQAPVLRLKRGSAVCRRGERLECFYGVVYGQVKLVLRADSGEEKVLRIVGPGETFGEALVFRPRPNPVDAISVSDALVIAFPARSVHALLERDPDFARALLGSLSERMHNLVEEIEAGTLLSARQRIATYLLALTSSAGRVRLPVTKTLIASHLGVTKETFSRLLREFADHGLIVVDNRDIELNDRDRLVAIAHPVPARSLSDRPASESSIP
jgi:CRP/FNR family transcriptional regulator, dissimilatory nitrate respiration regulator